MCCSLLMVFALKWTQPTSSTTLRVISRPGPEPTRPPAHSRLRRWQDIAQGDRAAWLGVLIASQALSEWERSFCVSVRALIVSTPWKPLSAKQVAILDRVVAGVS